MSIVLRAFPIRAREDLEGFVASLKGKRKSQVDDFYRSYGVSHETWHIQDTPFGQWVICLTIVDNPTDAAPRYAKSSGEFELWFKSQVMHVTGIDLNVQPLGPPTEQVFAWSDGSRQDTALL